MLTWAGARGVVEPRESFDSATSLANLARRFPGPAYPTHGGEAVVARDLNQDGIIDVAWADLSQEGNPENFGAVEVRLGRGDATLGPKAVFPTDGRGTFAITASDLDGDGFPDIAVANLSTHNVSVLLGNGDGTFGPPSLHSVGFSPRSIAAGRLDGDDHIDLVVGNRNSHDLTLLFGRGDGTFEEGVFLSSGGVAPYDVAVADMNDDGHSDLVVANAGSEDIAVFLGVGEGSFALSGVFEADRAPKKVVVADFTGDGFPDIATSNTSSKVLNVFAGDGLGGLEGPTRLETLRNPSGLASADLDRDGRLDLVTAVGEGQVFWGRPGGQFEAGPVSGHLGLSFDLALADLDGDEVPDLVTNGGLVARGLGDGRFDLAPQFAARVPGELGFSTVLSSVRVVDLDVDGFEDVLVDFKKFPALGVLRGRGDGSFEPLRLIELPPLLEPDPRFFFAVPADVNDDGVPDIVGATGPSSLTSLLVLLGRGSFRFELAAEFRREPSVPGSFGVPIVADFNSDGIPDVVTGSKTFLGTGDGGLVEKPRELFGIRPPAATADVNGDGHVDIVSSAHANFLELHLGRGDGTFAERELLSFPSVSPKDVFLEDIDGDGFLDIILAEQNGVRVAPGNGDGTFREEIQTPGLRQQMGMALGDIDGDGLLDAVSAGGSNGLVTGVLLGNGDGTFREPQEFVGGDFPTDVALADLDGDCRLDIVVVAAFSGGVLLARPGAPLCAGDCDGDRAVSEEDIRRAIGLIFDAGSRCSCPSLDADADRAVRANDLLAAVRGRAAGCEAAI